MKVLVPVKRVIDYNVKPRVKMDGSGGDLENKEFGRQYLASELEVEFCLQGTLAEPYLAGSARGRYLLQRHCLMGRPPREDAAK